MMTPSLAALRHFDVSGDAVRPILDVQGRVLQHRRHAGIERDGSSPPHQRRPACNCRHEPLDPPVVQRQDVVLLRFVEEELLQFLELVRIFRRDVLRLAEIFVGVVQLPLILGELGQGRQRFPRDAVPRHRGPAVMVDPAIAEHFEVLRSVARWRLRIAESVRHADALDRLLLDAVDGLRLRQFCCFQNSRCDIDDVMPLRTDTAGVFNAVGPRDHHAVARPAVVRRHLLGPLEWSVARQRPTHRNMRETVWSADSVEMFEDILRCVRNSVEQRHLIESPCQCHPRRSCRCRRRYRSPEYCHGRPAL